MQKLKYLFYITFCLLLFVFSASFVYALEFTPQVGIGNGFETGQPVSITGNSIANYIIAIYKYAITAIGIIATIVLMIGGIRWLTAGGSPEATNDAKAWIKASISGLVLMLCSYLLLAMINTNLVEFKTLRIDSITKIETPDDNVYGCCIREPQQENGAYKTTKTACDQYASNLSSSNSSYGVALQNNEILNNVSFCANQDCVNSANGSGFFNWTCGFATTKYSNSNNTCKIGYVNVKSGTDCLKDGKAGICDGNGECVLSQSCGNFNGVSGNCGKAYPSFWANNKCYNNSTVAIDGNCPNGEKCCINPSLIPCGNEEDKGTCVIGGTIAFPPASCSHISTGATGASCPSGSWCCR